MRLITLFRFRMATIMMFVASAAAASALFVKIMRHVSSLPMGWSVDAPTLFITALALTAIALASWKDHTANQTMLQFTLTCVGCLILIWIGEAGQERVIRYWFQGMFAATVTLPLMARRIVKTALPRGSRRTWWKNTCDAVFFAFLNMILVSAGGLFQAGIYVAGVEIFALPVGP
jgi:hypothetical protein